MAVVESGADEGTVEIHRLGAAQSSAVGVRAREKEASVLHGKSAHKGQLAGIHPSVVIKSTHAAFSSSI